VKAHYTFGGAGAGNLPFVEGAIFEVSAAALEAHKVDGRWVTGWNKGREGKFPGNYVEKAGYVLERNFKAAAVAAAAAAAASSTVAEASFGPGGLWGESWLYWDQVKMQAEKRAELIEHFSNDEEDLGEFMDTLLLANPDISLIAELLQVHGNCFRNLTPELRANKSLALSANEGEGYIMDCIPDSLRADWDVIYAVVTMDGTSLQFASSELRANFDVVLAAVTQDGSALEFASEELRSNKYIVEAAGVSAGGGRWARGECEN